MTAYDDPRVAAANQHWDALLRDEPPDLDELVRWQREQHMYVEGPLVRTLRPNFVTRRQLELDARASELVWSAIRKTGDFVLSQPAQSRRYLGDYGARHAELFALAVGHSHRGVNARLDGYVTEAGLRFFELNTIPAGREDADSAARMFTRFPTFARFQQRFRLTTLSACDDRNAAFLAAYRDWGGREAPVFVLFRPDGKSGEQLEPFFRMAAAELARVGIEVVIARPGEVVFAGGELRHGPVKITMVSRLHTSELEKRGRAAFEPVFAAIRERAACLPNPYDCYGHKALFAAVSDPRCGVELRPDEHAAVREHIPWTRVVCDEQSTDPAGMPCDLLRFLSDHRERLVLKPTTAMGGQGVLLGAELEPSVWDRALQAAAAVAPSHVAQERVHTPLTTWPLLAPGIPEVQWTIDRCPFLVEGRMGSYRTRMSPTAITNVSLGGSTAPTFVLEA